MSTPSSADTPVLQKKNRGKFTVDSPISYYTNVCWKDWNDNKGQEDKVLDENKVDWSKIDPENFLVAGLDTAGSRLFVAREVAAGATPKATFTPTATCLLDSAGEYHPIDGKDAARMIANTTVVGTPAAYQVLSGEQIDIDFSNYQGAYALQWETYDSDVTLPNDAYLQSGVDSSGNALYVCRALYKKVKGKPGWGYALGVYNMTKQQADVRWKSGAPKVTKFQLLRMEPVTEAMVYAHMGKIARAAYAGSGTSSKLTPLNMQADTCTFFRSAQVAAGGFNLNPANVQELPPAELSWVLNSDGQPSAAPKKGQTSPSFLNQGFAAESPTGAVMLGFKGTISFGKIDEGSLYDWANNFFATQLTIPNLGQVHAGFYCSCMSLMGKEGGSSGIYGYVANKIEALKKATKDNEAKLKINIAGHSKGGAMATLAAVLLKNQFPNNVSITVTTYGAPMAGDRKFVQNFNNAVDDARSFLYAADFVPWLPLSDDMMALGTYSVEHWEGTIGAAVVGWLAPLIANPNLQAPATDSGSTSTTTPQLGASAFSSIDWSKEGFSLFVQLLFGEASISPKVDNWTLNETRLQTMNTILNLGVLNNMPALTNAAPNEGITALYQYIHKGIIDGAELAENTAWSDVLQELPVAIGLAMALVVSCADKNDLGWSSWLKSLRAYSMQKVGGTDHTQPQQSNFYYFMETIVPQMEQVVDGWQTFLEASWDQTKELGINIWESRYARTGVQRYMTIGADNGMLTLGGTPPSVYFAQLMYELSLPQAQNLKEQNPIEDHASYFDIAPE